MVLALAYYHLTGLILISLLSRSFVFRLFWALRYFLILDSVILSEVSQASWQAVLIAVDWVVSRNGSVDSLSVLNPPVMKYISPIKIVIPKIIMTSVEIASWIALRFILEIIILLQCLPIRRVLDKFWY